MLKRLVRLSLALLLTNGCIGVATVDGGVEEDTDSEANLQDDDIAILQAAITATTPTVVIGPSPFGPTYYSNFEIDMRADYKMLYTPPKGSRDVKGYWAETARGSNDSLGTTMHAP